MSKPTEGPGTISSGEVYRLDEFRRRTVWEKSALRTARRSGLRVIYFKNRGFVRGSDFLAFLDEVARNENGEVN